MKKVREKIANEMKNLPAQLGLPKKNIPDPELCLNSC